MLHERRTRRSDDTITALHYQLAFARREAELEAVVLVDETGCLVAGAGAWPVCEELAAYAPLLANPAAIGNRTVGSRVASLREDAIVHSMSIDGCEVLLCGRGALSRTGSRLRSIERAAAGCKRILGAPPAAEA